MARAFRNIEDFVRIFHVRESENLKVLRSSGEFQDGFRVLSPTEKNAGIFYRFLDNAYYVLVQNEIECIDKWVSLQNIVNYNPQIELRITDEMKKFYMLQFDSM